VVFWTLEEDQTVQPYATHVHGAVAVAAVVLHHFHAFPDCQHVVPVHFHAWNHVAHGVVAGVVRVPIHRGAHAVPSTQGKTRREGGGGRISTNSDTTIVEYSDNAQEVVQT